MDIDVTQKSVDGATVIYVCCDLTTNTSPSVEAKMLEIIDQSDANVVVNVEKVGFIASTGLRIILSVGKRLSRKGLKLSVCSMNPTTKAVFEMSGFTQLFPAFDTEEDALTAIRG